MTKARESNLYEALLALKNEKEARAFFKDLCTPQEISSLQERWRICQLLSDGNLSYREIAQLTNASLTTIGRVSRFLKDEDYGGYKTLLKRFKDQDK